VIKKPAKVESDSDVEMVEKAPAKKVTKAMKSNSDSDVEMAGLAAKGKAKARDPPPKRKRYVVYMSFFML
jgi:hypothetical protein